MLNCQCEAFETLGAAKSEGMSVSRLGGDELAPRSVPEVDGSAEAVILQRRKRPPQSSLP